MRIGIVTLVSANYGNKFQNYAVEKLLKEYGDVETFALAEEYSPPKKDVGFIDLLKKISPSHIRQVLRSRMMYQYDITNTANPLLLSLIYIIRNKQKLRRIQGERNKRFMDYQKQYLHISERVLSSLNCNDEEWLERYDFFFCGSDQIWNPSYRTTSSLAFLTFAKKRTAATMAPSFGVSFIPEERKQDYAKWIKQIEYLSVREEAGKKIIKDLTGREAEVLLDPTMAIDAKEWERMAKKPVCKLPQRYILCYFLGCIDRGYQREIKKYSKRMKLPVVSLFDIMQPNFYVLDPNEVLYVIKNATIVLTDSFHGTVFSILFHKDFVLFERNEGGASMNSRLVTLLEKMDLKERKNILVDELTSIDETKWLEIDNILCEERKKTISYIKRIIEV